MTATLTCLRCNRRLTGRWGPKYCSRECAGTTRDPAIERFWRRVTVASPDDCWPWTGELNSQGYGRFIVSYSPTRQRVLSHRFSYQLATGEDINGRVIMHRCDNPPCVNPAHLAAGTQSENMTDAQVKGRTDLRGLAVGSEISARLRRPLHSLLPRGTLTMPADGPPVATGDTAKATRPSNKLGADLRLFLCPQSVSGIRAGTPTSSTLLHTCGHRPIHTPPRGNPPSYPQLVHNRVHTGVGRVRPTASMSWAGNRHGGQPSPAPRSPEPPIQSNTEPPMSVPAQPCPDDDGGPAAAILDAAYDILSVASLHAQDPDRTSDDDALAVMLALARSHGLSTAQLCDATGLDEPYVTRLLREHDERRAD